MRIDRATTWLLATLLLSGCDGDDDRRATSRYDVLDVDYLWQGSVPVEFAIDEDVVDNCREEGETGLLIPFSLSSDEALRVELYGCWQGETSITCEDGVFGGTEIDLENEGRVILSLLRDDSVPDCPASEPSFRRWRTFEIDHAWRPGELEVIVRNSDRDLIGRVTVD